MTTESARNIAIEAGRNAFGASWGPDSWASAPGRLELLGNHIDYSGGSVLAGAIDRAIQIAIRTSTVSGIHVALALGALPSFTIDPETVGDWHAGAEQATPEDYLRGVIAALRARSIKVMTGLQLAIAGDVPIGFGMSSSAALCVSAILALAADRPPDRDIVLIAQDAEHRAGSPVGAMDQSASVVGDVILFNGGDVSWQPLHPELGNFVFAVAESGVHHALSTSSYPTRVDEAQKALERIRKHLDPHAPSLAAVSVEQLDEIESANWIDSTLKQRVRHVVLESQRVAEGIVAISQSDWSRFGYLMQESGRSSAGDYEISHPVVEELVSQLNRLPGVLGARMMGGGEGGPALALLDREAVDDVRSALNSSFYATYPIENPEDAVQICTFGPGASIS